MHACLCFASRLQMITSAPTRGISRENIKLLVCSGCSLFGFNMAWLWKLTGVMLVVMTLVTAGFFWEGYPRLCLD
ncbi:hypothetical protein L6452_12398 [Arctium lappa]|uniref:Uncharacterized protein n=1 Tax=Arctium lappa TaxID=4217 RepID=A0ACB9DQG1_ARCLA|nr:hypothetical protein L6452_12398 [Arctium lappa]